MSGSELFQRLVMVYREVEIEYPHLRVITLAQWMLESGKGTSALATEFLNFGGLKWRREMAPYASKVSYQAHDGLDNYCKFADLSMFIKGYWAFLDRAPYAGWREHAADEVDFIKFIGPTYCPNPGYVEKVLALRADARRRLSKAASLDNRALASVRGVAGGSIVIDPGHGGTRDVAGSSQNNATAASGKLEKTLTLEFALLLEKAIADLDAPIAVTLTRRVDENLTGAARARIARDADLFLSIHFNGHKGTARGTEVFYGDQSNGNAHVESDMEFAQVVLSAAYGALRKMDVAAKNRKIKSDTLSEPKRLAVLSRRSLGSKPQACLLELEFIDNRAVDRLLVSGSEAGENMQRIAEAVAGALVAQLKAIGGSKS